VDLGRALLEVSGLLGVAVVLGLVARRIGLHVSIVLAAVGFVAATLGGTLGLEAHLEGEGFEEVIVAVFLPVLVFEAVLAMSTRDFFRNLVPILALATVALAISAGAVGLAVHLGLGVPLVVALIFGVLISATDPVAVVAVFSRLGVPPRLLTLVEGESLLNDGVAIVGVSVLVGAALGGQMSVAAGLVDFVLVFVGGAVVGVVIALVAAAVLPWLDRLAAATLSVAVAYGGFLLAEELFGFSGVMATVAAGLVLGELAQSRASEEVRETWHRFWESLEYVANAVLFLLIGLVIEADLLVDHAGAIALAIVAVLVARAIAVVPLVGVLERVAHIPKVGRRNQAVLVWGGLRGGVALALALALPSELADRDLLVAMTGGVVLATLLLNATTISTLVRRVGLDQPSRPAQFLAAGTRLSAADAAMRRLRDLEIEDPVVVGHLEALERRAWTELAEVELSNEEELHVVIARGLATERRVYEELRDAGMLSPSTTRVLLHEVDDTIEEVTLGRARTERCQRRPSRLDRMVQRVVAALPSPVGDEPDVVAYAEASARRLAARRTRESLELLSRLPNISREVVEEAAATFGEWEERAVVTLAELDAAGATDAARHGQALGLSRVSSTEALDRLTEVGLLPASLADDAARVVAEEVAASDDDEQVAAPEGSEARPVSDPLRRPPQATR
jgi:monovalent cation:H+ antiporter, CPA1 family